MTPTPESEARLRAALRWSARQMPAAVPPAPIETSTRRRRIVGIAASIAAAGALAGGLLVMPRSDGIQTVTSSVADTSPLDPPAVIAPAASASRTTVPATTAPRTTVPATKVPATTTYVLQPYDWIGSVATQFGITMEQLVALNGWSDGLHHVFLAGDTILVPAVPGPTVTG